MLRCSVVEEPQVGVHQSDALLITGINHNLVSSGACRSCDVLNTALQTHTEGRNISKDRWKACQCVAIFKANRISKPQ